MGYDVKLEIDIVFACLVPVVDKLAIFDCQWTRNLLRKWRLISDPVSPLLI